MSSSLRRTPRTAAGLAAPSRAPRGTRQAAAPAPAPAIPPGPEGSGGEAALRSFAEAHGQELRERGQPVATMDRETRHVVWIHQDGTRRTGRDPDSPLAASG
jgi:hypothetical protein